MGTINKGTVASIKGNLARVIPAEADRKTTPELVIPWTLRGRTGLLEKGTAVIYAEFEDATGILLGRADGEWGEYLPKLTADSVVASGVRLEKHTHGNVEPGTGMTGQPK